MSKNLSVTILCIAVLFAAPSLAQASVVSGQLSFTVPTQLSIPSIKVSAPIKAMGLTTDGKMAVPDNYKDVGWFAATIPGMIGNAVLGAHVDNGSTKPTVKGVFKNLKSVKVGDDIYVTNSAGKKLHYKVTATKVMAYNSADTSQVFGPTNESRLNIITCHGKWLSKVGTYDQRFVVFSKLV